MTSLKEFEKILDNIHKLELVPNDPRAGGDMNKPRVRAELDKLDVCETEDGLGDYMLGVLSEYYLNYPDWPTEEHKEQAFRYFEQAMAKGYAPAKERVERILKEKAELAKQEREREERRVKWKTDNPLFPWQQEFEKKPAGDWKIEKVQAACREKMGAELPLGYVAFLKAKDGFKSEHREIFEAQYVYTDELAHDYCFPPYKDSLNENQAPQEKRYFVVGRGGGGTTEWSSEQKQYVKLPWEKYYAYDYETKRYVRLDAETGTIEESYATFTEMFKAIWAGVITEEDYIEKLPEVKNWKC